MILRRMGDVVLSLLLAFLCMPVALAIALAVWSELMANPIWRVERVTRDGRIVRLFRFRTTEETSFGPRLILTGVLLRNFHLDQLPQILNVLNGDISLFPPDEHGHGAITGKKALLLRER